MNVLTCVLKLKYLAMFGILFLCGLGLPIPEEVTLVTSGLLVGWKKANFFLASAVCVLGILAGDSIIFGLGYHYGRRFLESRPMRFLLPPRRQEKVGRFFANHGSKAVFFARFFAGIRLGVYAYAGSQRMRWSKFIVLDLLGALISGPTSVVIGMLVASHLVTDQEYAYQEAMRIVRQFGHWLLLGVIVLIAGTVIYRLLKRRRAPASTDTHGGEAIDGVSRRPEVPVLQTGRASKVTQTVGE
jgi:membrane protein DedA with SNARE-associated domain